ncbi:hypothetical protein LRP50_09230 [Enterovibrio sp. ZSDZ42]|uniref:Uncharacterized protein n=1 Tax=Enterovibrio gelatinilyticus TaxID=2899819 RepID=A0ABT5QZ71_9GAMM|nr:hypothetical protein [Enterovibrio sp. ZSDZ42]MDD1793306.1 hypothetical protein [Enterovibrio sp. ZSDZ42]
MKDYQEKLEIFKQEYVKYLHSDFVSEAEDTDENVRIKSGVLNLLTVVKKHESYESYKSFKDSVVNYLCEISGCSEDLAILEDHCPEVLSPDDIEYIIQYSALSRWF